VSSELRFSGVELYFDDVEDAKRFYSTVLGLDLSDEQPGHFAQFDGGNGFICLERKGSENYPSRDKVVLFFEVPDLDAAIARIGAKRIVGSDLGAGPRGRWAVLHDSEGHNILLLERRRK
jgi:predicted enzyme related to lactoylglutathione lyase